MSSNLHHSVPSLTEGLGEIVLAGHFDPAAIATLLPAEGAARLEGLSGSGAVPIHSLAEGLAGLGIRTTVLGGIRHTPDFYVCGNPISVAGYNKRGSRAFSLTGFDRERQAALQHIRRIRPSLVHAHWTMEAARAAADWSGPKILTVHDAACELIRLAWSWRPGAMAYRMRWFANTLATLRRFDHVVAVSPFIESYLRMRHRFRGEIRVIPNVIPRLPRWLQTVDAFPKSGRVTFACYGDPGGFKNILAAVEAF